MWFTETPWPPIILLSVIGVLFYLGWVSQRRAGFLVGAALCIALCGVVWLIEKQIVTERELVEQRLLDFTTTFQRESLERGLVNVVLGGPVPRNVPLP